MTAAKRKRTDGLSPEARRFRRARRATVSFGYVIDDQLVIVGSGVAVSGLGRGVVVTAHHVLAGAGSGLRVLVHGRAFRQGNDWSLDAKFVDLPDNKVTLNAGHDITLMRIDHDFRNRTVALKSNIRLAEGDRIGACGSLWNEVASARCRSLSFLPKWSSKPRLSASASDDSAGLRRADSRQPWQQWRPGV